MKQLPKKYKAKETEAKWQKYWADNKIFKYNWDEDTAREDQFIIDTPPPTVSGKLHMGHIYSYSHADFVARYMRMSGKNVFYPIGFDDNGLPTERYIEKLKKIKGKMMPRDEFIKICQENVHTAEDKFEDLFKSIAFSFDWDEKYQTISEMSRRVSQMSFMDLYEKGVLYQKEEPVIWDVIDQTALAQTEVEEREYDSQMNYIKFGLVEKGAGAETAKELEIMTTRPELLPACVAVMCHPEDAHLYEGKEAISSLGVRVPIVADEKVDREKGTGVVMCCTFGDQTDVEWWKIHKLRLRLIMGDNGRITFDYIKDENIKDYLRSNYSELEGLKVKDARAKVLEILVNKDKITRNPVAIKHMVKTAERSKFPIEIVVTKQWFIKVLDIKQELHKKASQCEWHPAWMEARIHNWIDGLSWDWCISRQRFSGVPVPVWYSKRAGEEGKVLVPSANQLPVDPMVDLPKGYSRDEIIAETDVLDTWATSSISPQLSSHKITDKLMADNRSEKIDLPFDLRPQAHEIIRTWAFCTIVKAHYHTDGIPWKNLMISGWCLAEDKTKMSKSKGNIIDPTKLIDQKGSDAVRYWASNSHIGMDSAYSEDAIKIGVKLTTKIFNASKFAAMNIEKLDGEATTAKADVESGKIYEAMDLWLLTKLSKTIEKATESFEKYEYARAREAIEDFFWNDFCDNYLEIVKVRCYGAGGFKYQEVELTESEIETVNNAQQSAIRTIYYVLNAVLKMFAPIVPHVAEEIFSCIYEDEFNAVKSISARGTWAKLEDFIIDEDSIKSGELAVKIVAEARKYKSDNNLSMNAKLQELIIKSENPTLINVVTEDVKDVTGSLKLTSLEGEFSVEVKG